MAGISERINGAKEKLSETTSGRILGSAISILAMPFTIAAFITKKSTEFTKAFGEAFVKVFVGGKAFLNTKDPEATEVFWNKFLGKIFDVGIDRINDAQKISGGVSSFIADAAKKTTTEMVNYAETTNPNPDSAENATSQNWQQYVEEQKRKASSATRTPD